MANSNASRRLTATVREDGLLGAGRVKAGTGGGRGVLHTWLKGGHHVTGSSRLKSRGEVAQCGQILQKDFFFPLA